MLKQLVILSAALGLAFIQPLAAQTKPADKPAAAKAEEKGALIDINSASQAELMTLKGIGEARAKAIIAKRPYGGKDDLRSKEVLTKPQYDDIKDKIIAKQAK
jgi:competence protein ComEA